VRDRLIRVAHHPTRRPFYVTYAVGKRRSCKTEGPQILSEAGNRLIAAASEARAIARGESEPAHVHEAAQIDVGAIRARTRLSQNAFAAQYGFTLNQVRDWEQKRSQPLGGVRACLMLIADDPGAIRQMLDKSRSGRAA
jgi:putative transcriptional regulator